MDERPSDEAPDEPAVSGEPGPVSEGGPELEAEPVPSAELAPAPEPDARPEAEDPAAASAPEPRGPVIPADLRPDWAAIDAVRRLDEARRLDVLGAYRRVFDRFLARPGLFIAFALPAALLTGLTNILIHPQSELPQLYLLLFVIVVVNEVAGLAVASASAALGSGTATSVGTAVRAARGRAFAAIRTTLVRLAASVALFIATAPLLAAVVIGARSPSIGPVLVSVGALLLALALLTARWSVSGPVILLEGAGALEALGRSLAITRRNTIRVLGLYLLVGLTTFPLAAGSSLLGVVIGQPLVSALMALVSSVIAFPILSLTAAVIHGELTGREPASGLATPSTAPAPAGDGEPVPAPRPVPVRPTLRWGFIGTIVAIGAVALAVSVPRFGDAIGRNVLATVPEGDRGHILVGRVRNPSAPCHPDDVRTSWGLGTPLYIGGYFTRPVGTGEPATVDVYRNGRRLASVPLPTRIATACYYELEPVSTLPAGHYRIAVMAGTETLADGEFDVN
jgi:MFS family permease